VLPCVPRIRALPSFEGSSGAAMCLTVLGGLWITGIKKSLAALGTQLGSCVSKACSYVTEVTADMHAATVHPHIAVSAQLTTPGHGYNSDMTRQDGITGRAMFSVVER
jgi:hypothetical protein